jgi:hypothetical protein
LRNKSIEWDGKTLKYGDIDTILKDIAEMPEVSREEKEVKNKNEIIKALEKGILSMLKKGYSIKATTDFLNERLSPYSISETEVKKLLRNVTEKKKASGGNSISKRKEKSPASNEGNSDNAAVPSTTEKEKETETEADIKVQTPDSVPEGERIYLTTTIGEKDKVKMLGARYEPSVRKWYIWKNLPQDQKEKFKEWLPQG